jgi:geranylgeranyl reductase family protein
MSEHDHDVIVIGGSANGSQAAYSAARQGVNVGVIEEHHTIGLPEHCSGLFSYSGLELIDSMPPKEIIFNENIYGSRIIAPNGKVMTVRKADKHAIVSDRAAFDRFLMDRAIKSGAKLYQPYKAILARRTSEGIDLTIQSQDGEKIVLSAKMIISAEGIRGTIANQLGLKTPEKKHIVNAAQFYMKDLNDMDLELVEVYQNREYARDFFAWVIPMSDNTAKVGLGTSLTGASKVLEEMFKNHPVLRERVEGAEIIRKTAGRIPFMGPIKKSYADKILLTGDVAGQTKPTTGGGVILGGVAAQIAGKVAANAVMNNDTSVRFLKNYQKMWKKEIFSNLRMMGLVRNYMNKLSDPDVDDLFNRLDKKNILSDMEKYGDVDDQATLVKKFMFTAKLYPFYLKTSGRLIKSLFQTYF